MFPAAGWMPALVNRRLPVASPNPGVILLELDHPVAWITLRPYSDLSLLSGGVICCNMPQDPVWSIFRMQDLQNAALAESWCLAFRVLLVCRFIYTIGLVPKIF